MIHVGAYQNILLHQNMHRGNNLMFSVPAQTCYGRMHGPKGYGFGGGAGTLNTDSGNQMDDAEKDKIQ